MKIRVVMLGTSGSSPTKARHLPSTAVVYNGDVYLFDCGEGTQMQMLKYGVNISKVKAIFISHLHGDHVIGIAGLIRTLAMNNRKEPLFIFVPKGYERSIKCLVDFDKAVVNYQVNVFGIRSGIVYSEGGISVSAFRLNHTIPTFGYAFRENDRLRFDERKAKAAGLKGEMFSRIMKKGNMKIGRSRVMLKDVTWLQRGKSIVYVTDTRPVTTTLHESKGADLLIHEASYLDSEGKLARERKHSTALEAARLARKAGARRLVLTHISARYKHDSQAQKEARKLFKNTDVASDGYAITI